MIRTKPAKESSESNVPLRIVNDDVVVPQVTPMEFKRGPKGKYDETTAWRIGELAQLGLTSEQIAMAIGVNVETLKRWMEKYPEVRDHIDYGRWVHDHSVQKSLLQKARGFTVPEVKHVEGTDSIGRPYSYTTTTNKYYPPDMTAVIFWLKNRHRDEWRDVYTKNDTTINVDMRKTLNLNTLSKEEVEMLEGVAMKQIAEMNGTTG
jgi:hypothetical protein